MRIAPHFWVVEWYASSRDAWITIMGSVSRTRAMAHAYMRGEMSRQYFKLRIRKYVRSES